MKKNRILCISRQLGSDGREIGKAAAAQLGIPCYDRELLSEALKSTDISAERIEKYDEKKVNAWLHTLIYEGSDLTHYGKNGSDLLFDLQKNIIRKYAAEGPCVFIGRCADAILKESEEAEVLSVFIAAPLEDRIERVRKRDGLSLKDAAAKIAKTDKNRKAHYEFYAEKQWGNPAEYDLMINSSSWEREKLVDLLCRIYREFGENDPAGDGKTAEV